MPHVLEFAKAKLSYPLYACDFDPKDASTLVVGGGGGAGKSGVGNKIVRFAQTLCITLRSCMNGKLTPPDIDSPKDLESV
jgi:hypothetical protein